MLVVSTAWAAWHGELVISALPSMPPSLAAKGIWRLAAQGTDHRCTGQFSSEPRVASLVDGSIVMYYWHRCWD